jgi:hypothetical protein
MDVEWNAEELDEPNPSDTPRTGPRRRKGATARRRPLASPFSTEAHERFRQAVERAIQRVDEAERAHLARIRALPVEPSPYGRPRGDWKDR